MSTRKWTCLILLAAVVLLIVVGHFLWTRGVYVRVTNNTPHLITHVDITYRGGVVHIAKLLPATSYGRYVNPVGVSDLELEWFDLSQRKHSRRMGVYLERNYAGTVQIRIEPDNRVLVVNKVKLRLLLKNVQRKPYFAEE